MAVNGQKGQSVQRRRELPVNASPRLIVHGPLQDENNGLEHAVVCDKQLEFAVTTEAVTRSQALMSLFHSSHSLQRVPSTRDTQELVHNTTGKRRTGSSLVRGRGHGFWRFLALPAPKKPFA